MLCDGCDQGYHCYCVGLDEVPYDAWRCLICANDESDSADVDAVDQSDADAALARGLQRAAGHLRQCGVAMQCRRLD